MRVGGSTGRSVANRGFGLWPVLVVVALLAKKSLLVIKKIYIHKKGDTKYIFPLSCTFFGIISSTRSFQFTRTNNAQTESLVSNIGLPTKGGPTMQISFLYLVVPFL